MEFGRGLLQPRSVFQTAGGQIANSLRDAFSTVQEQKDRELKRKLSEREVGARERAAGATELGARAQMQQAQTQAIMAPAEIEQRRATAEAQRAQAKKTKADIERDKEKLEIDRSAAEAQAKASTALANLYDQHTKEGFHPPSPRQQELRDVREAVIATAKAQGRELSPVQVELETRMIADQYFASNRNRTDFLNKMLEVGLDAQGRAREVGEEFDMAGHVKLVEELADKFFPQDQPTTALPTTPAAPTTPPSPPAAAEPPAPPQTGAPPPQSAMPPPSSGVPPEVSQLFSQVQQLPEYAGAQLTGEAKPDQFGWKYRVRMPDGRIGWWDPRKTAMALQQLEQENSRVLRIGNRLIAPQVGAADIGGN
jgi:hypothetical protein